MITLVGYTLTTDPNKIACDFGCDSTADIENLPTTTHLGAYGFTNKYCAPWSLAIIAADKSMYYLRDVGDGTFVWTKMGV